MFSDSKIFFMYFLFSSVLIINPAASLLCQVSVGGPGCVIPGVTYQYTVTAAWDSGSTMQVCLQGGAFISSSSTCQDGPPVSLIKVIWNRGSSGAISIHSSKGNAMLNVAITDPLQPGGIDSISNVQTINYKSIPAIIRCSAASGGSCRAVYHYQWQQSSDGLQWMDIRGANNPDLIYTSVQTQARYYRRKVAEIKSGSIGYSNAVAVYVNPAPLTRQ